jgi:hypothetical protein
VARFVRYAGDRFAHSSELDAVVGDAADVGGSVEARLADVTLRGGEL